MPGVLFMSIHDLMQKHLETIWSPSRYGANATIELISPSGDLQEIENSSVVYTQSEVNHDGCRIVKDNPRVDIRISDLTTVPAPGEKWIVRIPASKTNSTLVSHMIEGRPIKNRTHGIISLSLKLVTQQ